MTAHERIDAAIAALDLARTDINECDYENIDAVLKAGTTVEDAAYDLVDEVIRLRKWQSEAVGILKNENLYLFKGSLSEKEYQINLDTMDRLITEAHEAQEVKE